MFNYKTCPGDSEVALRRYLDYGDPIQSAFLQAVTENDLMTACVTGNDLERTEIWLYVSWLLNEAPPASYGSPEKVRRFIEKKAQLRAAQAIA